MAKSGRYGMIRAGRSRNRAKTAQAQGPMVSVSDAPLSRHRWFSLATHLRTFVRRSEYALVALAIIAGGVAGLAVVAIVEAVGFLHHILFGVAVGGHLSNVLALNSPAMALIPAAGGLI